MMNYIKSECYRVVHTKTFYIVMAVLSGLVLLMNTVNSISGHLIPDFRYDTFRFSPVSYTHLKGQKSEREYQYPCSRR